MSCPLTLHEAIAERLRNVDQRYTSSRRAVVDVLERATAPLTIRAILEADSSLAQSSAYRTLTILEAAGTVTRIVTADDYARYELAEDLTEHHHHLICSSCGDVRDFTVSASLEKTLDGALQRAASRNEFIVDHHRLDLIAICADCS